MSQETDFFFVLDRFGGAGGVRRTPAEDSGPGSAVLQCYTVQCTVSGCSGGLPALTGEQADKAPTRPLRRRQRGRYKNSLNSRHLASR